MNDDGMRLKIGLGILMLSISWGSRHAAAAPGSPPNIVFILADDLGWRDTSVYGSDHEWCECPDECITE